MKKRKKKSKKSKTVAAPVPVNGAWSPKQYGDAIAELNLSQVRAARFLGVDGRTVRKWIAGDARIPTAVALLLSLMIKLKLEPDEVR